MSHMHMIPVTTACSISTLSGQNSEIRKSDNSSCSLNSLNPDCDHFCCTALVTDIRSSPLYLVTLQLSYHS